MPPLGLGNHKKGVDDLRVFVQEVIDASIARVATQEHIVLDGGNRIDDLPARVRPAPPVRGAASVPEGSTIRISASIASATMASPRKMLSLRILVWGERRRLLVPLGVNDHHAVPSR